MFETLACAELETQHVELLPSRTVLSVANLGAALTGGDGIGGDGGTSTVHGTHGSALQLPGGGTGQGGAGALDGVLASNDPAL